ncbi:MAG: DUF2971 domain-containing protein [Bacteroidia bacterium]|nr:DUF2971 domain-containing protein [Bacteroidia bacterium]
MKFNDWEYFCDNQNGSIIPNRKIVLPNSFIKYFSLTEYNVNALINSYLFFSHPLILNDPFDSCRRLISLNKFSESQFINLMIKSNHYVFPDSPKTNDQLENFVKHTLFENKEELLDITLNIYWNLLFKDCGILSLSEIDNDLLMWSYYTNHEGFVIDFNNSLFNNNNEIIGPFPINYSESYITISPESVEMEKENLLYVTNVKSNRWLHEKEWRFILNRENMSIPDYDLPNHSLEKRKINYGFEKINSIILGYKFFKGNLTNKYLGKGKRFFELRPNENVNDKFKIQILDFLIENKIKTNEMTIEENNTYNLKVSNMKLICVKKGKEYIVESEY